MTMGLTWKDEKDEEYNKVRNKCFITGAKRETEEVKKEKAKE